MVRHKKTKKKPLSSTVDPAAVSRKVTQSTISQFHTLLKQKAIIKRQITATGDDDEDGQKELLARLVDIESKLEGIGGLKAYQEASRLGQADDRGGDSSKILVGWLKEGAFAGKGKQRESHEKIRRLLELGALYHDNYASCSSWIDNHPIDLKSNHPQVLEQDFFERPLPRDSLDYFDIVSCSLVLNFVSEPTQRGRMLELIHQQLRPVPTSLLFLVLPLPCVVNSRYLSVTHMQELMAVVGFEMVKERWKNGGKVGYWLWAWREPRTGPVRKRFERKQILVDGPKKNNFSITLPSSEP